MILARKLIRFAFRQFYNRFAFTYDFVSAAVSRGEWRNWTRAGIPFLRGTRILELAVGTANLHLDLYGTGYTPIGIDLSPYMLELARKKFRAKKIMPRLTRADVGALPFRSNFFSSLVLTFPPGFMFDADTQRELYRVVEPRGVLVWVDAAYLEPRDSWSRSINFAFQITGTGERGDALSMAKEAARRAAVNWEWRVEQVTLRASRVHVYIATKSEGA